MDIFILVVYVISVLIVLPLTVFFMIRLHNSGVTKKEKRPCVYNANDYPNEVRIATESEYEKVKSGKIKQHLITNSADYYDSNITARTYRIFLCTPIMKKFVLERKESKYNG